MLTEMMNGTLEEHIQMVFDAVDREGEGSIGVRDIVCAFASVGTLLKLEEAEAVLEEILEGSDSQIVDYDIFRTYCDNLDRVRKLAQTPITTMAIKRVDTGKDPVETPKSRSRKTSVSSNGSSTKDLIPDQLKSKSVQIDITN